MWSFDGGVFSAPSDATVFKAGDVARISKVTIAAPPRLDPVDAVTFNVVAPSLVTMKKTSEFTEFPVGFMGALMRAQVTLQPLDVSFYNIEAREESVDAVGVFGYFDPFPRNQPPPDGLRHVANTAWFGVSEANIWQSDDVIGSFGYPPSRTSPLEWDSGGFDWLIPWNYRLKGASTPRPIVIVQQRIRLQGPEGKVTITKGGACTSRFPDGRRPPCTP
jgi:hypothetical protein